MVNGYKVVGVIAIALALVAIASVVVILLNFTSSGSLRVEVSSRIAHLNVTAVALGSRDFVNVFIDRFGGMVSRVIVFEDFSPEMMQYADRSTILIVDSEWLKANIDREEVKEMIKTFVDRGSIIYVDGGRAGLFLKMVYGMWAKRSTNLSLEGLQELYMRMENISEEMHTGIGYVKVSEKYEVIIYGSPEDVLNTVTEYREISLDQCERAIEYRFYNNSFGTGNPYGRVAVLVTICKIMESIPNYDWYLYHIEFQTIPGKIAYGSSWETAHEYLYHKVWNAESHRRLWDYSPTTTWAYDGKTTITVTVSGIHTTGLSHSEPYIINWLAILDYSNFNTNEANWEADINEQQDPSNGPSTTTTTLKYNFIIETTPGFCSFAEGKYGVMWGKPGLWWEYKTFWTDTKYLDLCP